MQARKIPFFSELRSLSVFLELSGKNGLDILLVCCEDDTSSSGHSLYSVRLVGIASLPEDLVPTNVSTVRFTVQHVLLPTRIRDFCE